MPHFNGIYKKEAIRKDGFFSFKQVYLIVALTAVLRQKVERYIEALKCEIKSEEEHEMITAFLH